MSDAHPSSNDLLASDMRGISLGLLIVLNHVTASETNRAYINSAKEYLRQGANEIERLRAALAALVAKGKALEWDDMPEFRDAIKILEGTADETSGA